MSCFKIVAYCAVLHIIIEGNAYENNGEEKFYYELPLGKTLGNSISKINRLDESDWTRKLLRKLIIYCYNV